MNKTTADAIMDALRRLLLAGAIKNSTNPARLRRSQKLPHTISNAFSQINVGDLLSAANTVENSGWILAALFDRKLSPRK